MKKTVLKYGSYGFLVGITVFLLAFLLGDNLSYSIQEVIGYTSMVASLSFIYFGIKHYRDNVNNGLVSLGKAIIIGLLISIFVGMGVAIIDYIYTTVINPDFATEYLDKTLAASIVPAIPLALSLAPGESDVKSVGSVTLESISPLIIIYLLGYLVPF